jgi:hypothetical protein
MTFTGFLPPLHFAPGQTSIAAVLFMTLSSTITYKNIDVDALLMYAMEQTAA